jgi:hypothetical protein
MRNAEVEENAEYRMSNAEFPRIPRGYSNTRESVAISTPDFPFRIRYSAFRIPVETRLPGQHNRGFVFLTEFDKPFRLRRFS